MQNLAEWREELARQTNRPKQWIIRDDVLVELSRRLPPDQNSLESIRGWDSGFAKHSEQVLAIIQRAQNTPKDQWPTQPKRVSLSKVQEAIVDVLMAIVRLKAAENSVTASVLVNRKQLEKLVSGEYDCAVLQGWRKEIVGNELIAMLENNRILLVKQGQLMLEAKT